MANRDMTHPPTALRMLVVLIAMGTGSEQAAGQPDAVQRVTRTRVDAGHLSVVFRDNAESPRVLSGIGSLVHRKSAPGYSAFTAQGGLNFEHIIAGHRSIHNRFSPRHGPYTLWRAAHSQSVRLVRLRQHSPWEVSSMLQYTVRKPHYVDFTFECTPHAAERFGARRWAIFFFANYMHDVAEVPIHFRGVRRAGGPEQWICADTPAGHPDWNQGGTFRHRDAPALRYDANQEFRLNNWSYDYPRFTKPFYYGRSKHGMVFLIMFDRTCSQTDQIRFSLFKFLAPEHPADAPKHPARDFQYVINKVQSGKQYGFRGRLVWKPFVSAEDCLREYIRWAESLGVSEGDLH